MVGVNNSRTVYFSYATEDVTAFPLSTQDARYAYAGGLVGQHTRLIIGCFAKGSVTSSTNSGSGNYYTVGGLVGEYDSSSTTVAMSFRYVGQVVTGYRRTSIGDECTFLQLNDFEFYLNELGWNVGDWDFSNLDFLNGLYPKLVI